MAQKANAPVLIFEIRASARLGQVKKSERTNGLSARTIQSLSAL